jgi:DNA polymerase/3'-5' exonuclease PolX
LVGYTYYKEFIQRIPRDEVSEIEELIRKEVESIDPQLLITTCGSYRRQKPTCGDIDILVTHPDYSSSDVTPPFLKKLVERLKSVQLVTDILSLGDKQFHGVVKLPKTNALHLMLDILWITREQFHCGLMYFTGSGFFNIQMRKKKADAYLVNHASESVLLLVADETSVGDVTIKLRVVEVGIVLV